MTGNLHGERERSALKEMNNTHSVRGKHRRGLLRRRRKSKSMFSPTSPQRPPRLSFTQNPESMSALDRLWSCRGGFTHADEPIVFQDSHLNPDFDHSTSGRTQRLFLFLWRPRGPSERCRLNVGLAKLTCVRGALQGPWFHSGINYLNLMFMTANKNAYIVVTRCGERRLIWYQLISIPHGFEFALYDFPSGPAVVWVQQADKQHM